MAPRRTGPQMLALRCAQCGHGYGKHQSYCHPTGTGWIDMDHADCVVAGCTCTKFIMPKEGQ